MRRLAFLAAAAAALALPAAASAHAGKALPVASGYLAQVVQAPAGLEAKVVGGDRGLWLRPTTAREIVVLGFQGEPYIRLTQDRVEVNEQSPTAAAKRAEPPTTLPPVDAEPRWRQVADGPSYGWDDDRLRIPHWTVQLRVDGKATRVSGTREAVDPPSKAWFVPIALALLAAIALLRVRDARLQSRVVIGGAAVALAAIVVGRAGVAFEGHPEIGAGQIAGFAVTVGLAAVGAALLASTAWRTLGALLICGAAVYVGLTLVTTLTRGAVLAAIPAWLERGATVAALAAGLAVGIVVAAGEASELWSAAGSRK